MVTTTHRAKTASPRPVVAMAAIAVLWFLGLTAVGGSLGFFLDLGMKDPSWIQEIPLVVNWAVPGLILGVGFGIGSLVTAVGVTWRPRWPWLSWLERATKHHWGWVGTLALGIGMMVWIGLQLIWLAPNPLHVLYGAVGLGLVVISAIPSYRTYLPPSNRIV